MNVLTRILSKHDFLRNDSAAIRAESARLLDRRIPACHMLSFAYEGATCVVMGAKGDAWGMKLERGSGGRA